VTSFDIPILVARPLDCVRPHADSSYAWARIRAFRNDGAVKKIRCLLGIHNYKTVVTEGESYLKCRHCGKYGGTPARLTGGWGYKS
jgi:hypothetical protein